MPYVMVRSMNRVMGLHVQVIDTHLKDHEWLAAGQYSIADIANFSWIYAHAWAGVHQAHRCSHNGGFPRLVVTIVHINTVKRHWWFNCRRADQ